jgi:flagellar motor switch protein FliM
VESLLGGATGERVLPDRPLSGIELNVVQGGLRDVCQDVVKAFQPLEELDVGLVKVETNPRLVNIVPPEAVVMLARFVVDIESREGEMALVIPLASLEPLREKLREGVALFSSVHSKGWDSFLRRELLEMEVEVRGEIGRVSLTAKEIFDLEVGDVLDLGCLPSEPARMTVEGRPKYLARLGVKDGRNALSLTEPVGSHR